jgi:hypothetical protein
MATNREYFDKFGERVLTASRTVELTIPTGKLQVQVQVHYDFDAPGRYLSLYIPIDPNLRKICESLIMQRESLLNPLGDVNLKLPQASTVYGGFAIQNSQAEGRIQIYATPLCEPKISGHDLPFTHTIFIYSDAEIGEVELALLRDFAKVNGITLRWRGPSFAQERSRIERPVAFISHDSRDKEQIARPLAIQLQRMLCPVWFDEFALKPGDSLREKIEHGLKETAKCIVILSANFLSNKRWTKVEFNSVFTREIIEERNVFLPVWHSVTPRDVYEYSPSLANRVGVQWSLGLEEVARRLLAEIRIVTDLPTESNWRGQ